MMAKFAILVLLVVFFTGLQPNNGITFKMTNAVCESRNKSWVVFENCRLHAVHRNKTIINVMANFLYPTNSITLRLQVQKKFNGYKPWLVDVTIDACKFLKSQKKSKVISLVYNLFKDYSNINHSCPYEGKQIIAGYYAKVGELPLNWPTGDYALLMTWMFSGKIQFVTNVYFTYVCRGFIICA